MPWRNTSERWGRPAVLLHWLTALAVVGLFGLGLWMTDLTLYDPWYHKAPFIHKSVGVVLFAVVALRLVWRWFNPVPGPLPSHSALERRAAGAAHGLLYGLLFSVMASGYLISTADGRPVEVFGWFEVPAVISGLEHQEDLAGQVHLVLASTLIGVAALHALAALKHHFIDRDCTLLRMLGR